MFLPAVVEIYVSRAAAGPGETREERVITKQENIGSLWILGRIGMMPIYLLCMVKQIYSNTVSGG